MTQKNTLLGLMAQTSIHAGTGRNISIIDLPIQREGHNGWPCIFGSSMKGALRARAEDTYSNSDPKNEEVIKALFGTGDNGGAIMVSDARMVLLPVRSLTSQFKWVTCAAVLQRLVKDMQLFGGYSEDNSIDINAISSQGNGCALSHADDQAVFLEEYRFSVKKQSLDNIINLLCGFIDCTAIKSSLEKQLLILSNDDFTYLVQHATPVNAHIAINSETKIVEGGALWYEETLPPETLLYVGISATDSRIKGCTLKVDTVMENFIGLFEKKPWLQIGGNETVGMGWCALKEFSLSQNTPEEAQ